jgi:hypothetical protein
LVMLVVVALLVVTRGVRGALRHSQTASRTA